MTVVDIHPHDHHIESLANLPDPRRGARLHVEYAMTVLPSSAPTSMVVEWLRAHGVQVSRQTVATHLTAWRRVAGVQTDTQGQPVLTPDHIEAIDAISAPQVETDKPQSAPTELPIELSVAIPDAGLDASPSGTPDVSEARPRGRWASFAAWVEAQAIWVLYMGLISAAAYGLYEVLHRLAGAPLVTSIVTAASVELVAIACKILADRAGRERERHDVVRGLYTASGVIAGIVAGVNAWGHYQLPGEAPAVSAGLYAMASVAGFTLAAVATTLRRRAELRAARQLEGAGLIIPEYVTARYGAEVATRAQLMSRVHPGLDIHDVVSRARTEIDTEAAEAAEAARLAILRQGVIAQSEATHSDHLAARLAAAQYSDAQLSALMTADDEGHRIQVAALRAWIASHRTDQ